MNFTVDERRNYKPVTFDHFIVNAVGPFIHRSGEGRAEGLTVDVVLSPDSHFSATVLRTKRLAVTVGSLTLGYQQVGGI